MKKLFKTLIEDFKFTMLTRYVAYLEYRKLTLSSKMNLVSRKQAMLSGKLIEKEIERRGQSAAEFPEMKEAFEQFISENNKNITAMQGVMCVKDATPEIIAELEARGQDINKIQCGCENCRLTNESGIN